MDPNKSGNPLRGKVDWSYKTIMENGSEELRSVVNLITGGHPPGKPIKGEKEYGQNEKP